MMNATLFQTLRRTSLAVLTLALPAVANAQLAYTITDLGTLGGTDSVAQAINNSGQIAGYSHTAGNFAQHAFLYSNGAMLDLGTLGGANSYGEGINNNGKVVGYADGTGGAAQHAFLYDGAGLHDLGTLGGTNSAAYGINDAGQIVGDSDYLGANPAVKYHSGFFYNAGTMQRMYAVGGTNNYGRVGYAYSINNSADAVGYSDDTKKDGTYLPPPIANYYLPTYSNGQYTSFVGTLSTKPAYAWSINNAGYVAGEADYFLNSTFTAYLATGRSGLATRFIGTLGGSQSSARSVNNLSQVVGYSDTTDGNQHAFLFLYNTLFDLNTLLPPNSGWILSAAYAINDNGWIVGTGTHNGQTHAFLLTPTNVAVSGKVGFEGIASSASLSPAAPFGTLHVFLRTPGTATEIYSADVTLTNDGSYSPTSYALFGVPRGTYDIALKTGKTLRVLLPNVTISNGITLPQATLPAGDANGDNSVDIADFGLLVNTYGGDASILGSGYDPQADFNYDGVVDIADFGLLVNEYNNVGAL